MQREFIASAPRDLLGTSGDQGGRNAPPLQQRPSSVRGQEPETGDKDQPLREDIRLLGRLLGHTIRAQEGEAVFELVETIRQQSVRFRRDEDAEARLELEAILDSLSPGRTIEII